MTSDLIGLTFYEVSDSYKKKFLTIYSHLQFEHHPIRKILDEFRKWLEDYIREKNSSIKQATSFFHKDDP
jgi:hypothetical protein